MLGAEEETHDEELFGPAEGLHATYRMIQDEVLEAAWRAGGTLGEPRLDTYMDVNRAVARFLEVVKLSALLQRPGEEPARRGARRGQRPARPGDLPRAARGAGGVGAGRVPARGASASASGARELVAAREEPSLEAFLPRRGEGLALSATDIDLYRTCPLKYKFARVFGIPQEQTINQRFGIVIHQVLERFHKQAGRAARASRQPRSADVAVRGRLAALGLRRVRRRAAVPRAGDRRPAPLPRARRGEPGAARAGSSASSTSGSAPTTCAAGSTASTSSPDGGYELIDYKTGDPKPERELESDVQLAIYRLAAREAWQLEAARRQLLVRARRREGRGGRLRPTSWSGSRASCSRSARGSWARTSSRAPPPRSAPGATSA